MTDKFCTRMEKSLIKVVPLCPCLHSRHLKYFKKVKEGNDQEMAQSERNSHSKNRDRIN